MRPYLLLAAFAALLALAGLGPSGCAEATPQLPDGLEIIKAEVRDVSPPLRELAKMSLRTADPGAERVREANPPKRLTRRRPPVDDPVVQALAGTGTIPTPIANFEGLGTGLPGYIVQSAPPDTVGDIGPDHYFQIVNFSLAIFDRAGEIVLGPVPTRNLWGGFAGPCAQTNDGDATVRYDRVAQRWIIGQFSVNGGRGPFYQCVAVSTSADPLGTYNRYQYNYAAFNDYPKLALWPNAYYFTFNLFQDNEFVGSKACAMDRAKLLSGGAATMHCFNTGPDYGGLLASDLDGTVQPSKDAPNLLVAFGINELQVWKMHVDFLAPVNDTFVGPVLLPVAPFTPLCDVSSCIRQPNTAQPLDSLGDRLMNRLVYRRFPTHESLLVSHAVTAGASGGIRWYELRKPSAAVPELYQQGTYAPDSSYRFMSSIAMDSVGNIALGFAISGNTVSPGIRYTGRLVSDPPGTLGQGEGTLVAGFGAQIGGLSRYGDYSSMNIDPVDDCTFWYTQEYIGATGAFNWRSRIGSFRFASCGAALDDFTLATNPSSGTVTAGGTANFAIETTLLSGAAQSITLSASELPEGVTARFAPPVVTAGTTSQLTLTAAAGARPSTAQVIITGAAPGASHTAGLALTVAALAPAGTAIASSAGSSAAAPFAARPDPVPASALPRAIPDNNGLGVVSTLEVAAPAGHAGPYAPAAMELSLVLRHPYRGDLVVTLTSPGGVRHVISRRADGAARDLLLDRQRLPAFAGQLAAGTWTLEVQDRASRDVGVLERWSLHPIDAPAPAATWSASAAPGLPIIDNGKLCSSVEVHGAGDAASVRFSLEARHDFGAVLRATLSHGGVTAPALATNTFAPRPGHFALGARPVPGFSGDAAGTWTLCLEDADGFGDTGLLTSWSVHD